MPPPRSIGKAIGEERVVSHAGCGLSLGKELDVGQIAGFKGVLCGFAKVGELIKSITTSSNTVFSTDMERQERQQALCDAAFEAISHEYDLLWKAVHGRLEDSEMGAYSQPWKSVPHKALDQYW